MSENPEQPTTTEQQPRRRGISRRQFLIGLGSGAGVLAVGAVVGGPIIVREGRLAVQQAVLNGSGAPSAPTPTSPLTWFEIDAENKAHLYIPKIEMGQGIHTSLAQIAADELEADWDTVIVHQGDVDRGFDPELIFTFGSTSITSLYAPIREVAATMRYMLREEAAAQFGVAVEDVVAENSECYLASDPETRKSYGEIVAAKSSEWVIPEVEIALKTPEQFRYIGQPVQRVDFYEKITGRAVYGYDARLPGMAYGAVARPPRFGATLARAAAGDAESQPGVVAVVIEDGFAGIVAESRTQAQAALAHLDLEWEGGSTMNQDELEALVTVPEEDGVLVQRIGDARGTLSENTTLTAAYRTPMAAHAHLEPQGGLADVTEDGIMIYTSTQSPSATRDAVADGLGVNADTITVVPLYIGGGFGRKVGIDAPVEAARLSRAVGRPVYVGWTRTEDLRYGYRRPPSHHVLSAALDDSGSIQAFRHSLVSSDIIFNPDVGLPGFVGKILGADFLATYGSQVLYNIPNRLVDYHHRSLPAPTAYWRGLGSFPNTFAMESFMDEIADAAGVDPLQLRLHHLPEGALGERYRAALEAVAEASNWSEAPAAGRGRGIVAAYDRGTVVALVLEASVNNGSIQVHHAWCAVDPGLVVNPDGAAAQVQGSIIMALSSALYEKQEIADGMITTENFGDYPLITMRDAPTIEVLPLNSSDEPIGGLGEPVVGCVPAALSNAVFAATGTRLREMPFRLA